MVGYHGSGIQVRSRTKPREQWLVLKPGVHEGYVDWDRAEAIRLRLEVPAEPSLCTRRVSLPQSVKYTLATCPIFRDHLTLFGHHLSEITSQDVVCNSSLYYRVIA